MQSAPNTNSSDATSLLPTAPKFGLRQGISAALLRLLGWRLTGRYPAVDKLVIIVAPHTSNWDFPIALLTAFATGLYQDFPHGFLMKASLGRWPFGPIMRRLGGIPVARTHSEQAVARVGERFASHQRYFLALAPEGTRRSNSQWRSGFWHIARLADVPVLPVVMDYGRREIRFGEPMALSDSLEADTRRLRTFFDGARGRRPSRGPAETP
jgi:1-acyl-sn-glycerol-3-phosphate acyltransferase